MSFAGGGGRSKGKGRGSRSRKQSGEKGDASPVVPSKYSDLFTEYRDELDARNDKHERLVKLSRDCTIHSKRAIFTLHQYTGSQESKEKVLSDADTKIRSDVVPNLRAIAMEIAGEDPHRHHRAFSPGLQEFIEALAYYKYLKSGRLISLSEAQEFLTFQPNAEKDDEEEMEKSDPEKDCQEELGKELKSAVSDTPQITLPLVPSDFLLGLADLTGELMRLGINSVGSGNRELPFLLLPFFRALYQGFHSFSPGIKYMGQKMSVLRSSLGKVENVCYTLKVRGSEIPKHMLMDVINSTECTEQEDL